MKAVKNIALTSTYFLATHLGYTIISRIPHMDAAAAATESVASRHNAGYHLPRLYMHQPWALDMQKWRSMSPEDWDAKGVDEKKAAFSSMMSYWIGALDIGAEHNISKRDIHQTLMAIMEKESSFNHRVVSDTGDLGLTQLSPFMQKYLKREDSEGRLPAGLKNPDYFSPYYNIGLCAYSFKTVFLKESGGNIEKAVKAYRVGTSNMLKGDRRAAEYHRKVSNIMKRMHAESE